ncbi:MAG: Dihydroorotate dehydrogenase B (NAD(+)), catalytic subunit [Ignavibacteria bacterium]|nr:Dihydroorotate dehydrogenase B (NAD(+)), catalytic subunit [Ignavibacteria bacterium]
MDLSTNYMGIRLKNPIVPSASPLSKSVDSVKRLEDAGASAVVVYSLFEEQITHESNELDHYLSYGTESYAESLSYFPHIEDFNYGPDEYLEHIRKIKKSVDIPIFGSLNGFSSGGWMKYAKLIEEAGANGLELNVYYIPTDIEADSSKVEEIYVRDLIEVKQNLNIPVAMKLSPFFSSLPNIAKRLEIAGADALVLFNRFYQPDFDLNNLEVVPNLELSSNWEMRLPLRWIALLYGKINTSFAATTGIHTHLDVLKMLMAGADVTQLCSELLHNGIKRITEIIRSLEIWMLENEYNSVHQMKGSMSQKSVADPSAFERANYMKALNTYKQM